MRQKRLKKHFSRYTAILSILVLGLYSISLIGSENPSTQEMQLSKFVSDKNLIKYDPAYPSFLEIFKNKNMLIPRGWAQIDRDKDQKPEFFVNKSTGFEATAFESNDNSKLVLAFRGMHIKQSCQFNLFNGSDGKNALDVFLGNIGIPFLGKVPSQFDDAISYYELMKKRFPEHKIILVGKSLGGALAELVASIKGCETYTFAAPGTRYALKKLDKKYQASIEKNRRSNFSYIKNYCNINDPCGNYGKHIGLSFVYPPVSIKKEPFYDIHGNIRHFMKSDAFQHIVPLPSDWDYRYTAALVYFDSRLKENLKPISMHDLIKIRYRISKKDLIEAVKILNKTFEFDLAVKGKKADRKQVSSQFKSTSY